MLVAETLRNKNRAEYLLYMWQVEDLIRANDCNLDRLKESYLNKFSISEEQMQKQEQWYSELIDMMHAENVMERGHLQINQNVLSGLTELHEQLLASPKFPQYRAAYYKVLPYIVELRSKSAEEKERPELETCFNFLYGLMLIRLQRKEVTDNTQQAATDIAELLRQLSDYYLRNRTTPIDFD